MSVKWQTHVLARMIPRFAVKLLAAALSLISKRARVVLARAPAVLLSGWVVDVFIPRILVAMNSACRRKCVKLLFALRFQQRLLKLVLLLSMNFPFLRPRHASWLRY